MKELGAPLEELKKKVVGVSEGLIDGDRKNCRAKECSMGNLVADASLARVKEQGITIAIVNGGGLRASIDQGDVSMGEVLTVLPFQNTIATFQIKGSDIKSALENGVSQWEDGAGRFAQVGGLKYSFDRSKPVGSRVGEVLVKEGDKFVPLDPAKTYGVVTNNYVRGGGDGFKMFATNAINAYDFGPNLEQTVADYLMANNPYKPYTDGRITDTTPADYVAPAKAPAAAPAAPAQLRQHLLRQRLRLPLLLQPLLLQQRKHQRQLRHQQQHLLLLLLLLRQLPPQPPQHRHLQPQSLRRHRHQHQQLPLQRPTRSRRVTRSGRLPKALLARAKTGRKLRMPTRSVIQT